MSDFFSLPFMQNALMAGVLIGMFSSYYGVFVVQRKMSFLGSGLAHAAFGGVALGLFLNQDPLIIAIPFTILVSVMITWVRNNSLLEVDTSIGIFFSTSMALGILLLAWNEDKSANTITYLFGSILAISDSDLIITAVFSFLTLLLTPLWGRWAFATFDSQLASAEQVPVRRDDYLLSALVAINAVIAMKMLGLLLVSAFLVIPPACARLISKSFSKMTLASVLIGALTTSIGLTLSYQIDTPSGATIILVQTTLFISLLLVNK